jgi:hypothetical protein
MSYAHTAKRWARDRRAPARSTRSAAGSAGFASPDSPGTGRAAKSARSSAVHSAACLATLCPARIASTALIRSQTRLTTARHAHQASHEKGYDARGHFAHLDFHVLNRIAICVPDLTPGFLTDSLATMRRSRQCGLRILRQRREDRRVSSESWVGISRPRARASGRGVDSSSS